jgi:peptidoglycan/LPS O-acetylase OafA/YrhL
MSFDKNHQSPDKLVDTHKRTTKVNLGVVIGVVLFFVIGGIVLWSVLRNPPQTPAEAVGKP